MKLLDWITGAKRRKRLIKQIEQQQRKLRIQSEKLDKHIAALDGEKDWFNRVCYEHVAKTEEIKNGAITTLTPVNRPG
jgi:hypothetical protein